MSSPLPPTTKRGRDDDGTEELSPGGGVGGNDNSNNKKNKTTNFLVREKQQQQQQQQQQPISSSASPLLLSWNDRYVQLALYKAQYGNCFVPSDFMELKGLADWVQEQRQKYFNNNNNNSRHHRDNAAAATTTTTTYHHHHNTIVDQNRIVALKVLDFNDDFNKRKKCREEQNDLLTKKKNNSESTSNANQSSTNHDDDNDDRDESNLNTTTNTDDDDTTTYQALALSLEWLNVIDLLSFVQVSKRWQKDIDGNPSLWKSLAEMQAPKFMKCIEKRKVEVIKQNKRTKIKKIPELLSTSLCYKNVAKGLLCKPKREDELFETCWKYTPDNETLKAHDMYIYVEAIDNSTKKRVYKSFQSFQNYTYEDRGEKEWSSPGGLDMITKPHMLPGAKLDEDSNYDTWFEGNKNHRNYTPGEIKDSISFRVRCFRLDNGKYLEWPVNSYYGCQGGDEVKNERLLVSYINQTTQVQYCVGLYIQLCYQIQPQRPYPPRKDWKQTKYQLSRLKLKFRTRYMPGERDCPSWILDGVYGGWRGLGSALCSLDWQ